jgi:branched-chain amino acid transport system ATP-binding protein
MGAAAEEGALLAVTGLRKAYGSLVAVDDVSLDVPAGRVVGVLGPNGAGKSTLFHLIAGHLRQDAGSVTLGGRAIDGLPAFARARLGIGIVFQAARLFEGMTVAENVATGRFLATGTGIVAAGLRLPRHVREERQVWADTAALLARVGLADHAGALPAGMPFGLQRRVAVARALAMGPRVLLLDEPAAGLTGGERDDLRRLLADLRDDGLTMLLVEHDVGFVAGLADRLVVLDQGRTIAAGAPDAVLADPRVIEAYSGLEGAPA